MIPIYSIDSFLSLWLPGVADYVNMLRDCYEVKKIYFKFIVHDILCGGCKYCPLKIIVITGVCAVFIPLAYVVLFGLRR